VHRQRVSDVAETEDFRSAIFSSASSKMVETTIDHEQKNKILFWLCSYRHLIVHSTPSPNNTRIMPNQALSARSLPLMLLLSLMLSARQSNAFAFAFAPLSGPPQAAHSLTYTTHRKILGSALFAKRIRKDAATSDSGDLPDFDLGGDDGADSAASKSSSAPSAVAGDMSAISPNMMGSSKRRNSSLKDLLTDRGLESKMQFDVTAESAAMPDLADLARASAAEAAADMGTGIDDSSLSGGKKRARQDARRAAAQALEPEAEEPNILQPLIDKLPNIRDEKGKVSAIKLLEAGAWAGIYLLVAWEIFINSPFFDRAGPMAPVVY
jgi:hypothetical protein